MAEDGYKYLVQPRSLDILQTLMNGPMTMRQLASLLDIQYPNSYRNLRELEIFGLVRIVGSERFQGRQRGANIWHSDVKKLQLTLEPDMRTVTAYFRHGTTKEILVEPYNLIKVRKV